MIVGGRLLKVGTRGSALALAQTRRVTGALGRLDPERVLVVRIITTSGDADKQTPLTVIGGQGVFVKELQAALLSREVDLAVHSAKDLSTESTAGLTIAAWLDRDDSRDVLISREGKILAELPAGARVGTSSRRRVAELRRVRPDLEPVELRGNLDTRLRKIREGVGQVDAGIVAAAGVLRMGWQDQITEYLSLDDFVPAPGQGGLAVECRADDTEVRDLLAALNEPAVSMTIQTERAFLSAVGGGCRSPIGAHATLESDRVTLRAMMADESLTRIQVETRSAPISQAPIVAETLAMEMLQAVGETDATVRQP